MLVTLGLNFIGKPDFNLMEKNVEETPIIENYGKSLMVCFKFQPCGSLAKQLKLGSLHFLHPKSLPNSLL